MSHLPYKFQVGEFECYALYDGNFVSRAEVFFSNAPADLLNSVLQAEKVVPNQIPSTWTCLLISDGRTKLLVDTGMGPGAGPLGGHLLTQLEKIGLQPADIDLVFLTHGHPDHIGGCADEAGRPAFPRARYFMGVEEHTFWSDESNYGELSETMVRFARKNLPVIDMNLDLVSPGYEILPGIKVLEAFGHTPGHLCLEIISGEARLLNLADLVLHPVHLLYPDWCSRKDLQVDRTIATRRRLLAYAAEKHATVLLFHMDYPSLGYVTAEAGGWRWQPIGE